MRHSISKKDAGEANFYGNKEKFGYLNMKMGTFTCQVHTKAPISVDGYTITDPLEVLMHRRDGDWHLMRVTATDDNDDPVYLDEESAKKVRLEALFKVYQSVDDWMKRAGSKVHTEE